MCKNSFSQKFRAQLNEAKLRPCDRLLKNLNLYKKPLGGCTLPQMGLGFFFELALLKSCDTGKTQSKYCS